MRINQKLRKSAKKQRQHDAKADVQVVAKVVNVSANKKSEDVQKAFAYFDIMKTKEGVRVEVIDYVDLLQTLNGIKPENSYVKKMETQRLPYEIPEFYSLQREIESLAKMRKRLGVLSQKMCKKDIDSIQSDWNKVGGDINEAICKSRRNYIGKTD